jgi:hypothetical protein
MIGVSRDTVTEIKRSFRRDLESEINAEVAAIQAGLSESKYLQAKSISTEIRNDDTITFYNATFVSDDFIIGTTSRPGMILYSIDA